MATARVDDEDITKCPICLEIYKKPKSLPCFHTYCEACLGQYITSSLKLSPLTTGDSQSKEFPCPVCRTPVEVADSSATPESIASKLPTNHMIISLLDQNKLKISDKMCDPCSMVDEESIAVSWCTSCNEALCKTCEKCHRTMKLSRNHKICPLDEMKTEAKSITTLEMCESHEGEWIKFYCMDHREPCCSACVTVHHRKCDHVKTLSDAAKGIKESPDLKQLSESLKPMMAELTSILKGREENRKLLDKTKQDYQDKLTNMRQEINKHLDLLEDNLTMELNGRYKECSILINTDINEIESSVKVLKNLQSMLDTVLKDVSDIHVFLEMDKIKRKHLELSETLKNRLQELKDHNIEVCFEDSWLKLSNMKKIGTVSNSSKSVKIDMKVFGEKNKNLQSCVAKEIRSFSVGQYLSTGIFIRDKILMVDYSGKMLYICTNEGKVEKELSVPGRPWDIVQLNDREAVVVLEDSQNIQYIDIENFTLGKLTKVDRSILKAISYDGTNLVVGGNDQNIYLIDRNGTTIRTLSRDCYTQFLTYNKGRVFYISGTILICLNMDGSEIFRFTSNDLKYGEGVSLDKEGNMYCCGYFSNNIHQITPDGKLIKLIIPNIGNPVGIAFDETGERFLVTHNKNNVTLYELSNP